MYNILNIYIYIYIYSRGHHDPTGHGKDYESHIHNLSRCALIHVQSPSTQDVDGRHMDYEKHWRAQAHHYIKSSIYKKKLKKYR